MRNNDVRDFFECVDAEPSSEFSEALLARLRAEYLRVDPGTNRDAERPTSEPITIDVLHEEPRTRLGRSAAHPNRRRNLRHIAIAAAVATTIIVVASAVVRTANNDGVDVVTPASPDSVSTTNPVPASPRPTGLPPEGATPSTPATGQLLARLPMPIWVYEDGRVISARWTTPDDWTGFLEQRLTHEGVELVRAEILAAKPSQDYCHAGGPGGYGYLDPGSNVCEHATINGSSLQWEQVYPRLWELPDGARSWLPASAWADPNPKPYVPSTYQVQINTTSETPGLSPPRIDASKMLAALPPEAAELLTRPTPCRSPFLGPNSLCFKVTTEQARQVAATPGITVTSTDDQGIDSGVPRGGFGRYAIAFLPYLPQGPVGCCGG